MSNEKEKLLTFVAMSMMMNKGKKRSKSTQENVVMHFHKCSFYPHIKMR
jgi:hypothetical protein